MSREPEQGDWSSVDERGNDFWLTFILACLRTVGHAPMVVLLGPITLYFFLTGPVTRSSSRDYLRRVMRSNGSPREPTLWDVYRHIYSFAGAILDRLALWGGAMEDFDITLHGKEHMQSMVDEGTGAFLIGAHLGSFDVLRIIARDADIPVNVVMYSANADRINETFRKLDPKSKVRLIELDPSSINTTLEIRRCVQRGEFVAVLADRIRPGTRSRVRHANFFGEPAAFPEGPFLLPAVLGLPVVMTIALRRGRRAYDIHLEPISDGSPVPSAARTKFVQQQVERYAARLEDYCRQAPLQWFNFYDFWANVDDEGS